MRSYWESKSNQAEARQWLLAEKRAFLIKNFSTKK